MPFIEGLDEQRAALSRIKDSLKEVNNANDFIKLVGEISKDAVNAKHTVEICFEMPDGTPKKLKNPMIIDDINVIIEAVRKYKENVAKTILSDSETHHISLTEQEKAALK